MTKPRRFSKAEIMDAARAAAETGMSARLYPSGEIVFIRDYDNRFAPDDTPEAALEGWLNGGKSGGRA